MNETIFIVYSVDDDHTVNSRQVIAVCETRGLAIAACKVYAEQDMTNEDKDISDADNQLLRIKSQTQNYTGEGQLMFEEHPLNTLIV